MMGLIIRPNLQDNLKDTPWCEGADGSGVGEKLTYTFDEPQKISNVDVVNGNGTTLNCLWHMDL